MFFQIVIEPESTIYLEKHLEMIEYMAENN